MAGGAIVVPLAGACAGRIPERLVVPPAAPPASGAGWAPGSVQPLGLGGERDGVLAVPAGDEPRPLLVMLHGAAGTGRRAMKLVLALAEARRCAVLAPDSRGATWDAIPGGFGPDVRFLERALAETFARYAVDRTRIAAAGFSDGATYALGLGRANGDLFSHIMAFSPGFLIPVRATGAPRIFVSHGRQDHVLPIDSCSRRLVPALRRERYEVRYREFDGKHEVPAAVAEEALDWFTAAPA
jgi:phospholipase/carboxylesterase